MRYSKAAGAVVGGGLGSALGTVGVWLVESTSGIDMPEHVELAVGVICTAIVAAVVTYFFPANSGDATPIAGA